MPTIGAPCCNGALLALERGQCRARLPVPPRAGGRDPGGRNARVRRCGPAPCWRVRASSTSSAATPPRPARRCCPSSRSTTACSGTPRTTKASRAARTSSIPVPPPTSTSCRWSSICCAAAATRLLRRLELHLGVGKQQDHARGGAGCRRPGARRALLPGRRDRLRRRRSARSSTARPSFVFNTLIGDLGLRLLPRLPRRIGGPRARPAARDAGRQLLALGAGADRDRPEACAGHISSSVYFESIDGAAQRRLRCRLPAHASRMPAPPRPMPRAPTSPCICSPVPCAGRAARPTWSTVRGGAGAGLDARHRRATSTSTATTGTAI